MARKPAPTTPSSIPEAPPRTDAHNVGVDETAAIHHQCGTVHLASGRECYLPERHRGGCTFTLDDGESTTGQ